MIKKSNVLMKIIIVALLFTGCSQKTSVTSESTETTENTNKIIGLEASVIENVSISSEILGKDMAVNIYLPKGYHSDTAYGVLYLFHGFGALSDEDFWLPTVGTHLKADELIDTGQIDPMIIVSPQIDMSFGYNTSTEKAYIDPEKKYAYGRYEDYIVQELIPYIDAKYSTVESSEWRYTGGFSGGGTTALFLAFKHENLFSKVGALCPALITDRNVADALEFFLYPTEEVLKERHPTYMAQAMAFSPVKIYLDVAENDDFKEECETLYQILEDKGMDVQFHINEGYHNATYVKNNLEQYLLFYGNNQ